MDLTEAEDIKKRWQEYTEELYKKGLHPKFPRHAGVPRGDHRDLHSFPTRRSSDLKDRNGMDVTEAEDIKKRWQEYTEELYKNDLQDPDNHDGVITDLEPDILECEVKWALEIRRRTPAS